jgi:hypothetical protein
MGKGTTRKLIVTEADTPGADAVTVAVAGLGREAGAA